MKAPPKTPRTWTKAMDDLMARFRSVLGDRIVDVRTSRTLVSSPCRLVTPEDNYDRIGNACAA
ncbi:MAG: hypothetical protein R2838_06825 [Caldilineaceae bacterium]